MTENSRQQYLAKLMKQQYITNLQKRNEEREKRKQFFLKNSGATEWDDSYKEPAAEEGSDTGPSPVKTATQLQGNSIGPTATAPAADASSGFAWDDQTQLDQAWQDYLNREAFHYDYAADPLYQQYKEQYTRLGSLAMEDTMGRAAALTGGYANSYAQTVGQQAYQSYLQQLNNVMPELYGMAYDRYRAEGEDLYQQIVLRQQQRQQAYQEYLDERYWQLQQDQLEYERQQSDRQWQAQQAQTAYNQQQDNYSKLAALIATGYTPTDAELAAAGMTRSQADAISGATSSSNSSATSTSDSTGGRGYDNCGYGEKTVRKAQEFVHTDVDGMWGNNSAAAAKSMGFNSLAEVVSAMGTAWFNYSEETHSALNKENGGSFYQQVLGELKNMKNRGESYDEARELLEDALGDSLITRSEYLTLINKYRENTL